MKKDIIEILDLKYQNKINPSFHEDIKRLKKGEPVAYIIGFLNFLDCKIDLSQKPFIPRVETEFWVEKAIRKISIFLKSNDNPQKGGEKNKNEKKEIKILDMFAGSGCIGVALLKHFKNSKVIFAEKKEKFLKQIEINCKINKISPSRYQILQSDIFQNIKGKFDFIFANPPYIPLKNKKKVQKSVLNFEPHCALFGGKDGLFYIRKFLKEAPNYLKKGGKIFMEFDPPQKPLLQKLIERFDYKKAEFSKDQYQRWRWVIIYCK